MPWHERPPHSLFPTRAMNELTAYSACPLCDHQAFRHVVTADCSQHARYAPALSRTMEWQQCLRCAHVFRSGYYTDEALAIVFRGTNENQAVGYDLEPQRAVSARMIEKVLAYQSAGGWLDVGFGNGSLLFTAQEYGFTPIGLDLRQQSVDQLQQLGITAICKDITRIELKPPVSVISMADVLEHMPFPRQGLAAAHRLLAPQGVLFISLPNTECMVWKAMDANRTNPYWGEIEHCHNFSRTRLYALLAECGFTPVRYGISERYRACMEVIALRN